MIYFDGNEFKAYTLKATYFNEQVGVERVKYDNSQDYWSEFVAKWPHLKDLTWSNVTLTAEQQQRLDLLNQQPNRCGGYDSQASLFVVDGIIYSDDYPPYLEALVGEYGIERPEQTDE